MLLLQITATLLFQLQLPTGGGRARLENMLLETLTSKNSVTCAMTVTLVKYRSETRRSLELLCFHITFESNKPGVLMMCLGFPRTAKGDAEVWESLTKPGAGFPLSPQCPPPNASKGAGGDGGGGGWGGGVQHLTPKSPCLRLA